MQSASLSFAKSTIALPACPEMSRSLRAWNFRSSVDAGFPGYLMPRMWQVLRWESENPTYAGIGSWTCINGEYSVRISQLARGLQTTLVCRVLGPEQPGSGYSCTFDLLSTASDDSSLVPRQQETYTGSDFEDFPAPFVAATTSSTVFSTASASVSAT